MTLTSPGSVFVLGDNPVFNCVSLHGATVTSVQWLINGTRLEDLSLTNVRTDFSEITEQGSLVFNNVPVEYNGTYIQCRVTLSNGETENSNNSTLLVQGEYKLYTV